MFVALRLCDVMCSNLFFLSSFRWVSVCLFCAVWFPSPVINFVSALLLIAPIPRGRSCSPFLVCQFVIVNRICCRRHRRRRRRSLNRVRKHLSFYTHSWYLTPIYTVHAVDVIIDLRWLMSARERKCTHASTNETIRLWKPFNRTIFDIFIINLWWRIFALTYLHCQHTNAWMVMNKLRAEKEWDKEYTLSYIRPDYQKHWTIWLTGLADWLAEFVGYLTQYNAIYQSNAYRVHRYTHL